MVDSFELKNSVNVFLLEVFEMSVLKISFSGFGNLCELEVENYKVAKEKGFDNFFAASWRETEIVIEGVEEGGTYQTPNIKFYLKNKKTIQNNLYSLLVQMTRLELERTKFIGF